MTHTVAIIQVQTHRGKPESFIIDIENMRNNMSDKFSTTTVSSRLIK